MKPPDIFKSTPDETIKEVLLELRIKEHEIIEEQLKDRNNEGLKYEHEQIAGQYNTFWWEAKRRGLIR